MEHDKTGGSLNGGLSRRRFMQRAVTAAAFTVVPRHVLGGRAVAAPSGKLNIAMKSELRISGRNHADQSMISEAPNISLAIR